MEERVQKILSQWGIASRRQAEKMILAGRVNLNGQTVHLGQKANPNVDQLKVDGKLIHSANRPKQIYLLLHKPAGVVSTCSDPQNRPTVIDLLPPELNEGTGIHPVGRLDVDSTGALILTNDGELTLHLTHPRYHLRKTYCVWVEGHPSEQVLDRWREGVILAGKKTLPASIKIIKQTRDRTLLEVILTEGRNRQIRRIAAQLGHEVIALHRHAIALIELQPPNEKKLLEGQYRFLKDSEVHFLYDHIYSITGKTPANIQEIRA